MDGAKIITQVPKSDPDALRILTENDVEFSL